MKGRITLASAATKASAKGRLSRARVGARSRNEGVGEERGRGEHNTQGNPENTQQARRHKQNNNTQWKLNRPI